MSFGASEKELRRVVADLATASPEDIEAVLGALAERPRAQVQALLSAYFGRSTSAPETPERRGAEEPWRRADLSPWLRLRLRGEGTAMTPAAVEALRQAAATLPADEAATADAHGLWRQRIDRLAGIPMRLLRRQPE